MFVRSRPQFMWRRNVAVIAIVEHERRAPDSTIIQTTKRCSERALNLPHAERLRIFQTIKEVADI